MPLADLLRERFKVRTRAVENPKVTSVGLTAVLILSNNPNRLGFTIINLSGNVIYLSLTNEVNATANEERGIRLDNDGGHVSMIWDEDFDMVAWAWWAISTGADSQVYALEVIEY